MFGVWPMATNRPSTFSSSLLPSLRFRRTPVTPMASPSTSSTSAFSLSSILPSAIRAFSLSCRIFSARKVSRRCTRVTLLAMLARYSASSTAVLPPPTTATSRLR
ncbi:hypothetical protein D9M71_690770 [compost metagenome]